MIRIPSAIGGSAVPVAWIVALALISGCILAVIARTDSASPVTSVAPAKLDALTVAGAPSLRAPNEWVLWPTTTTLAEPAALRPSTPASVPIPATESLPSRSATLAPIIPPTSSPALSVELTGTIPPDDAVLPSATPVSYAPLARLRIPSIGVDAAVETKSLDPDGTMQSPGAPDVVSWYDFSAQPVADGNAVFAGHVDYAGYGPAVFWRLGELQLGDIIEVAAQDGMLRRYQVTTVRPFEATADASGVVASAGKPTITLITCDGTFDQDTRAYNQRLVVTGERVD